MGYAAQGLLTKTQPRTFHHTPDPRQTLPTLLPNRHPSPTDVQHPHRTNDKIRKYHRTAQIPKPTRMGTTHKQYSGKGK